MTDKQIIKALECCRNGLCTDRPRLNTPAHILLCKEQLMCEALDLINRQKAEIERLNNLKRFENFIDERIHTDRVRGVTWEFKTKQDRDEAFEKELEKLFDIANARAEAVKKFAEIVKANKTRLFNYIYSERGFDDQIDNLVKEMVGEG